MLVKYISVLDMHSKDRDRGSGGRGQIKLLLIELVLTVIIAAAFINNACAELLDRIVAVVNNEVILLSELQDGIEKSNAAGYEKSESQILNELVDRTLLLEQALKFRIGIQTYQQDDESARKLIDDYINRRVKAFVHVPFEEIERYYNSHRHEFGDRDVYEVWDEVEGRLRTELMQIKINEHLDQLRKEAYIRIQVNRE